MLIPRQTRHVYNILDKLQFKITQWFGQSSKLGAWSPNSIGITSAWLKEGLRGRSITRDLSWVTKVALPGYENKCLYAWFDACIGYISITADYTEQRRKWWQNPDVQLYQLMGKDNGKFSKSCKVGVFGANARDTGIPSDVWRYYSLSRRPENGDTEFEWKAFIESNNNDLLKNLGNIVNRVVKFLNGKNYEAVIPHYQQYWEESFSVWVKEVNESLTQYINDLEAVKIRAALAHVFHISGLGNKLLQINNLDNKLAAQQPQKCGAVIGLAVNLVHLLASLTEPYLPSTSSSISRQLNLRRNVIPHEWTPDSVPQGQVIQPADYLFFQINPGKEKEWRDMYGGEEAREQREAKAAKAAARKVHRQRKRDTNSGAQDTINILESGFDTTASHDVQSR